MQQHQLQWSQSDCGVPQAPFGEPIVLVVEDSSDAPTPLASILKLAFPHGRVMVTGCVRKALDILAMQPVDIAVVDLELREGSGIQMVQQCFRSSPLTRCVITTVHDDDSYLIPALAAGALGYLLKNQPEIVLIQQLRLLAEGIPPLAPSVVRRLVRQFMTQPAPRAAASPADFEDDLIQLSAREEQVLKLIAKGMAIAEVARLLEITANTVCSHVKTIYRKRNVSSRAEAALEAKRLGLL